MFTRVRSEGARASVPSADGIIKAWEWLNTTILAFRGCFSRAATFRWFVVVLVGFIVWTEHAGVTSFIRELWINPRYYDAMLHFFRSNAWNIVQMRDCWIQIVVRTRLLFLEGDMPILVGDGMKQSKEAKKMPCVKKMHQESENSSKPSYIYGHMFGAIGVLVGNAKKKFCVPLSMTIQDGDKHISQWLNCDAEKESHVVRLIREACGIASGFRHSILLLDRYFLSVPALKAWEEEEQRVGQPLVSIITKAKSSAIAYLDPIRKSGRGRPQQKGEKVKLRDLFSTCADQFKQISVTMYGKEEIVSYLCKDLLWGDKLYRKLRFILVCYEETQSILVSTNLTFSPEQIIRLYSYRFKIECCFREWKQIIFGFVYHFWSSAVPKLNRYAKSGTDPLEHVDDKKDRQRILSAHRAIHGFVMISCIAMGLLQICALRFSDVIYASPLRWLRTRTNQIPSEATTADFLRKSIFRMFYLKPDLDIIRLIRIVQLDIEDSCDSLAA